MKLFAPKYYKKFSCIADRCSHSCCIGWEIDIDEETAKKYSSLEEGYGKIIKNSMAIDENAHFSLGKDERCPHLDGSGLCRIITELREDYLCEICREHPRFYNNSPLGKEVGLGMACEEAARIILSSDEYDIIEETGEVCGEKEEAELNTSGIRNDIYLILKKDNIPYVEKLAEMYERFDISPDIFDDEAWRGIMGELEYLDEGHKELFSKYSSDVNTPTEIEKSAERVLAYFIYRHCTSARDEEEYRAILGFCLFLERLFVSISTENPNYPPETIARIISEEIEYSEDNTEKIINEIYFA